LAAVSLRSLREFCGGDNSVTVLVKPVEYPASAFELGLLHFAILVRVMACGELLKCEAAPAWLRLLCGDSNLDQGQGQKER
jgi:hypothetical protein